ncbi:hypothetical protein B0J17DRAFT_740256 [Rhizoctonia solani]|nr:hypothetical protein B0J17DRAFT_740256 [Rhizoctonia solani]
MVSCPIPVVSFALKKLQEQPDDTMHCTHIYRREVLVHQNSPLTPEPIGFQSPETLPMYTANHRGSGEGAYDHRATQRLGRSFSAAGPMPAPRTSHHTVDVNNSGVPPNHHWLPGQYGGHESGNHLISLEPNLGPVPSVGAHSGEYQYAEQMLVTLPPPVPSTPSGISASAPKIPVLMYVPESPHWNEQAVKDFVGNVKQELHELHRGFGVDVKRVQCSLCDGEFDSKPVYIERHLHHHFDIKLYTCNKCPIERRFTTKDQAVVHTIKYHTDGDRELASGLIAKIN